MTAKERINHAKLKLNDIEKDLDYYEKSKRRIQREIDRCNDEKKKWYQEIENVRGGC